MASIPRDELAPRYPRNEIAEPAVPSLAAKAKNKIKGQNAKSFSGTTDSDMLRETGVNYYPGYPNDNYDPKLDNEDYSDKAFNALRANKKKK